MPVDRLHANDNQCADTSTCSDHAEHPTLKHNTTTHGDQQTKQYTTN